ncbi:MAG TPA: TrpB-like pyridoxal phosphate-dependent enzyme [Bacteroidetes bacterium]|nr:TrpB-like pyridoxal phosphate-dependent enzyme [Bacteroidota bacterium]
MKTFKKILLQEHEMPAQWYNIRADMPGKMLPPIHPATGQPIGPADLAPLFPEELIRQEVSTERFIDIPEEVQDIYKIWRPSPLVRATRFEKLLDAPVKIYFKNESVSPAGSHKPNTAVPQAYYNYKEGIKRITTETGAGQWGSALAFATRFFNIDLNVFMVKVSFQQKPYRQFMMNTWGADVVASPSNLTEAGRKILAEDPASPGSLGIAISEAIEMALQDENTKYSLGSVLNHVLMHQTIIGEETLRQFEKTDDYPDVVIGCFGGGSNFAGISFPFLRNNLKEGKQTRLVAVEPESCPKLTRGEFHYDFGDTIGMTPLLPMFTLGHKFIPPQIHAGGLRYHGAGPIISQLLKDNLMEAHALHQNECFEAGVAFARTEGIIPAPETTHAIAQVVREARQAREEGIPKTIVFNFSGHGLVDMTAYDHFLKGELSDYSITDKQIKDSIARSSVAIVAP